MQVVLVYFEWFRRNSLLKCVLQPKIAKNSLKPLFWGFKVVQDHRCWYPRKARYQCLLWCAASLCLSATILVLDQSTVAEIALFQGGTQIWCARKIAKKSLKTPILGGQGRSRSSMLVPLESSSAVLVMISSKSVSICSLFHARWANSGKITISKGGTPLWCPCSRGISSPSGTKITSLETRDSRLSYG